MKERILTGKQNKFDPVEKEKQRQVQLEERFEYEKKRKGQYELIYPWPDEEKNKKYASFIVKANELWDEFTTGKPKHKMMEEKKKKEMVKASQQTMSKANVNPNTSSKKTLGTIEGKAFMPSIEK